MNRQIAGWWGLVLFCLTTPAYGEAFDELGEELNTLERDVSALEAEYLAPEILERKHRYAARLSEGQLFFLQQDYVRASIVLQDLANHPETQAHPTYPDVLYMLAESLHQTRNYHAASTYFEALVSRGSTQQRQQAVGRLLEIAVLTGRTDAAERYLATAGHLLGDQAEPALLYAVGRYRYDIGELQDAERLLSRVPGDHKLFSKSAYLLGVLAVRARQLDAAIVRFEQAMASTPKTPTPEDEKVRELAILATARIHYERGELAKAVEAYAQTPRTSRYFDEALYESIWILVKQQKYEEALRRVDILMISTAEVSERPDLWLLQGQLLAILKQFNDASIAFQRVLFAFEPIQNEMRELSDRKKDKLADHFNSMIGTGLTDFDLATIIPEEAVSFAGEDVEADRATRLVGDLAAQRRDVDEANRTIQRLEVALNADNRIEIFPRLHEGWLRATEFMARTTLARAQLLDLSAGSASSEPAYQTLVQKRRVLSDDYGRTPRSVVQIQARDAAVDEEMARLDGDSFKLKLQINGLEAQLVAIEKYVADLAKDKSMSPSRRDKIQVQIRAELDGSRQLRDQLEQLVDRIAEERISVGLNDEASTRDEQVRQKYVAAVADEERWLTSRGAQVPDVERRRIIEIKKRLESFFSRAAKLVDSKIADVKSQVAEERRNIEAYRETLGRCQIDTERIGGRIAASAFRRVMRRIDAVALEADVGLIDVAWARKDEDSKQMSRLLVKQRDELAGLQRDYEEAGGD